MADDKKQTNKQISDDEKLIVLEDLDNGYEFYMRKLDMFAYNGQEYIVFAPFEPAEGEHNAPDIVIMRILHASVQRKKSKQLGEEIQFESILDRGELDEVFAKFNERMVMEALVKE